ncbi:unnamed protein product, partial [Owenia fusiformis]
IEEMCHPYKLVKRASRALSFPKKYRLTQFVERSYDRAKINIPEKLQTSHLEHNASFVKGLVDKVGDRNPIFKVRKILGTGSCYQNTKIIRPDETDYLLVLSISNRVKTVWEWANVYSIEICDKSLLFKLEQHGISEDVNGKNCCNSLHLVNEFKNLVNGCLNDHQDVLGVSYKGDDILSWKHTPASWDAFKKHNHLQQIYGETLSIKSKWRRDIRDPTLEKDQVVLDRMNHGPSVRVRIGGPLCTTDLDLCLCIDSPQIENSSERYVAVPVSKLGEPYWTLSSYEDPIKLRLDEDHRKILMVLKDLFSECKNTPNPGNLADSHNLKTFVLHHQERCLKRPAEERCLGNCLDDIVHHMFEKYNMRIDENNISVTNTPSSLSDMIFPGVPLRISDSDEYSSGLPVLFLYALMQLVKMDSPISGHKIHSIDRWLIINEVNKYIIEKRHKWILPLSAMEHIKESLIKYKLRSAIS